MESIGVMVPVEHIARVIGKQGAGLKQIREMTACNVQVQQNTGQTDARRVDFSGSAGQVAAAFQMIAPKAFPGVDSNPIIFVPAERVGSIVGRGGENLKKAREVCHVRVQVERDTTVDPDTGKQERRLTLQGESEQLAVALRCVLGAGPGGPPMAGPQAFGGYGGRGGAGMYAGGGMPPGAPYPGMGMGMMPAPGGMPGFAAHPTPVGMSPTDVQVHFTVPANLVGAVIGKGGEQIKQTASTAGCRVSMTNREAGERRAVIVGTYSQVAAAEQMLFDQISQAAAAAGQEYREASVLFFVKKDDAGAVIGKQGAALKEVREASGARIQLSRDEIVGLRPCLITGPFESVMQAQEMIYESTEPGAAVEARRKVDTEQPPPPAGVPAPDPASLPAAGWTTHA